MASGQSFVLIIPPHAGGLLFPAVKNLPPAAASPICEKDKMARSAPRKPDFQLRIDRERLLRILAPSEAGEVFQLVQANRAHLRAWMPWVDATRSPLDSRPLIDSSRQGYLRGEGFSMGLFLRGRLAGLIGFHAFDAANRITSLGYWLSAKHSGQGLMTAAVETCLKYAFEERDVNRLYIRCATENLRSRAIPERLGFQHEGTQREAEWLYDHFVDLEVYSLLQREWEARQGEG